MQCLILLILEKLKKKGVHLSNISMLLINTVLDTVLGTGKIHLPNQRSLTDFMELGQGKDNSPGKGVKF